MGYRQRGESSWEVNVFHKGQRRFATVASEQEAKEKEVELKAELIRLHRNCTTDHPVVASAPTIDSQQTSWLLGDAIKKTFELHWNGTKSAWWYRLKCKVLLAHFGKDKPLAEIDTTAMDGFRAALRAKGNGQATINHHLAALSMVFKIAHQRGGVAMKPVLGIKKARRVRKRWVNETEEKTMLALLTQWGKADCLDWYVVLVDTGMRPEETKQMTGAWCDFRTNAVHVQVSKTEAGIRTIPMTKRVIEVLTRRCLTFKMGKLFPYQWDLFTNQWDAMRKAMHLEADEDFVPYSLRHTFGTRLIQHGVNVEVVSKLMGHSTIQQTMEYAKLGAAQYVAAIAKLEQTVAE